MNTQYEWIATAAFGLEGVVARELERLGIPARAENGGARFTATPQEAMRANLWLRSADRVLLVMGRFEARSFEALFEGVRELPWEEFIGENTRFPVSGKCARSQLMSVRDCQAITKKAVVERLKARYRTAWFEETAETVAIDVALHGDIAQLTLDASGTALNRRYRTWNGEAPLRETLAAALVSLSPWRPGMRLHDPMCGTGTLMIEAAMRMADRAPGLTRPFAIESWRGMPADAFRRIRKEAEARFDPSQARTSIRTPSSWPTAICAKPVWTDACISPSPTRATAGLTHRAARSSAIRPTASALATARSARRSTARWACCCAGPPASRSAPSPRIPALSAALAAGRTKSAASTTGGWSANS